MDYEDDLEIDKFRLEEEWLNQPNVFMKYAELEASAKKRFDEAWEREKIIRSRVIKKHRDNKDIKNASQLEAEWRLDKKHREAKQERIDAEYEYNLLKNALSAFHQRKTALENMVKLYLSSYYSEPSGRTEDGEDYGTTISQKTTRDRIKNQMGRSKRRGKGRK